MGNGESDTKEVWMRWRCDSQRMGSSRKRLRKSTTSSPRRISNRPSIIFKRRISARMTRRANSTNARRSKTCTWTVFRMVSWWPWKKSMLQTSSPRIRSQRESPQPTSSLQSISMINPTKICAKSCELCISSTNFVPDNSKRFDPLLTSRALSLSKAQGMANPSSINSQLSSSKVRFVSLHSFGGSEGW